jgi:histidyl-tRNA synthetase
MIPDAECVKIVAEILTDLELGDFVVKVSDIQTAFCSVGYHDLLQIGQSQTVVRWNICRLWCSSSQIPTCLLCS